MMKKLLLSIVLIISMLGGYSEASRKKERLPFSKKPKVGYLFRGRWTDDYSQYITGKVVYIGRDYGYGDDDEEERVYKLYSSDVLCGEFVWVLEEEQNALDSIKLLLREDVVDDITSLGVILSCIDNDKMIIDGCDSDFMPASGVIKEYCKSLTEGGSLNRLKNIIEEVGFIGGAVSGVFQLAGAGKDLLETFFGGEDNSRKKKSRRRRRRSRKNIGNTIADEVIDSLGLDKVEIDLNRVAAKFLLKYEKFVSRFNLKKKNC